MLLQFETRRRFKDKDKRLRQMLSYGIDYQGIIDAVYWGHAVRCGGPVPEGLPGWSPDVRRYYYSHDPAKAKQAPQDEKELDASTSSLVAFNGLSHTDARYGLTPIIIGRNVLSQEKIGDAISATLHPERAPGFNWVLADKNGEAYDIETTATDYQVIEPEDGILTHASRYVTDRFVHGDVWVALFVRKRASTEEVAQRKER